MKLDVKLKIFNYGLLILYQKIIRAILIITILSNFHHELRWEMEVEFSRNSCESKTDLFTGSIIKIKVNIFTIVTFTSHYKSSSVHSSNLTNLLNRIILHDYGMSETCCLPLFSLSLFHPPSSVCENWKISFHVYIENILMLTDDVDDMALRAHDTSFN